MLFQLYFTRRTLLIQISSYLYHIMMILLGAYQYMYICTIKIIILIFHTRKAGLTKRDDQRTEKAIGHDDSEHTQHPSVLGAVLELPHHSLHNTTRDNSQSIGFTMCRNLTHFCTLSNTCICYKAKCQDKQFDLF